MKRFITYLFLYNQGQKDKAVGFVRTDQRENCYMMEIHVQGMERYQGNARIYLLKEQESNRLYRYIGVSLGEIMLSQGNGIAKVSYCGEGSIAGIVIQVPRRFYLASCWLSNPTEDFCQGRFGLEKEEISATSLGEISKEPEPIKAPELTDKSETVEEAEPVEEPKSTEESQPVEEPKSTEESQPVEEPKSTEEAESVEEPESTEESELFEEPEPIVKPNLTGKTPTEARITTFPFEKTVENSKLSILEAVEKKVREDAAFRRIDLTDIRKLPSRNWYMCNNSFVIHGFFNYHYLVLRKKNCDGVDKMYLGVPGIYEQPERVMAMLFGFPEFETEESELHAYSAVPKEKEPKEGEFGYWLSLLDM